MRILHLIPYRSLCPPKNGGALRCYHLLHQLARYHEVDLLVLQQQFESQGEYHLPENVRVFTPASVKRKKDWFDLLPQKWNNALRYRWLSRSAYGTAHSTLLEFYPVCQYLLATNQYDLVLFEHLSALKLAPLCKRLAPAAIRILDAHNVDHLLAAQTARLPGDRKIVAEIRKAESSLYKLVPTVLTCSEPDGAILRRLNGDRIDTVVVPNGVDVANRVFCHTKKQEARRKVLFCGALNYLPNINGLTWYYQKVWPLILKEVPDARLVVVGRDADYRQFAEMMQDASVDFIGEVDNVVPYYQETSVAIAPLYEGSGTRLKILEAMSLGNAVVATSKGAEGIGYTDGVDISIADDDLGFAGAVCRLLTGDGVWEAMRREARQLVERRYDWKVIGQDLNEQLKRFQ